MSVQDFLVDRESLPEKWSRSGRGRRLNHGDPGVIADQIIDRMAIAPVPGILDVPRSANPFRRPFRRIEIAAHPLGDRAPS